MTKTLHIAIALLVIGLMPAGAEAKATKTKCNNGYGTSQFEHSCRSSTDRKSDRQTRTRNNGSGNSTGNASASSDSEK